MTPIDARRHESRATTDGPEATTDVRSRSIRQTSAVFCLVLGVASICVGLYCLVQALDAFNLPMAFKVWLSRAVASMVMGWVLLHIGSKRIEAF
ncbi:hypothetical protein [Burkholderia reimsis]|uniref:hypothetical protein n=1 Tax=Burkholderia reimsis TaxID=2234132 RepID=UPI001FCC6BA5|nr:hypothetical protein [Burkholderia reimsis]